MNGNTINFMRIVIDASIIIASVKPLEQEHDNCINLLKKLQGSKYVEIYEPPEFLLELHSILSRQKKEMDNSRINFLTQESPLPIKDIVFITEKDTTNFIKLLSEKYQNESIRTKRAADLVYLWLSWRIDGHLITVDKGLLKYASDFQVINPKQFLGNNQN